MRRILELEVGSQCGGHGICGGDRIRIQSSARISPPTEAEIEVLGPELLAQGIRLACQTYPETEGDPLDVEVVGSSQLSGQL